MGCDLLSFTIDVYKGSHVTKTTWMTYECRRFVLLCAYAGELDAGPPPCCRDVGGCRLRVGAPAAANGTAGDPSRQLTAPRLMTRRARAGRGGQPRHAHL